MVDPYQFPNQGSQSPEGQAFVVEMHAAWRDWVANGSKGKNGAVGGKMAGKGGWVWGLGWVGMMMWIGDALFL